MALFKFILFGSGQTPILDVEANDLDELTDDLSRCRFLKARMVEVDGVAVSSRVLLPVGRIQMVTEVE